MLMNLLDIGRLLGIVCVGMDPESALARPTGAAIDSRAVKKGDLFFCLSGERADGHDFAKIAVEKGALAVVGSRDPFKGTDITAPVFVVPDVVRALGEIAAAHRRLTKSTVIGVTGTSGKTSVKETLAAVLGAVGETAKTPVNLNNQIGMPLSMLNASQNAAYWVIEAGISRPHDMEELGAVLRPDIALILNAGAGHVQELGDKGVAYYKARFLAYLARTGHGVVCADYPELAREAASYGDDVTYFSSVDSEALYWASYLGLEEGGKGRGRFNLALAGDAVTVSAPFLGSYGAENVAAVGATAHILGLTASEIASGFAKAELPAQRFSVREAGGFVLIDDSYNANPLSMSRMLDAAADMARNRGEDLLLVLGEMGDLGPDSPEYHFRLGEQAGDLKPKTLIWRGGYAEPVLNGLRRAGYEGSFMHIGDAASFRAAFLSCNAHSGVVLFKGSRSNKLEDLVAAFIEIAGSAETAKRKTDAL